MPAERVQNSPNIFSLQALANLEGLAEQVDIAIRRDLAHEGDPPGGDGQWLGGNEIPLRQLPQLALPAILGGCQAAQPLLNMLGVNRLFQSAEFALQGA